MKSRLLSHCVVGAFSVAALLARPAAAGGAEPSASEITVARRLFDEGRAAAEGARWAEAAAKFRSALAIKDTPGLRFHLARCEEEQGAFVEALLEYDRARELLEAGIKAPDVQKLLPAARERVRAKVALLTLRLPDGLQNVSLEVDGKMLSASVVGAPMPINPGRHRVRAVAVGRTPYVDEIALAVGEVREISIRLPFATTIPKEPAPARKAVPVSPLTDGNPAREQNAFPARTLVLVSEASLFAAALATGIGFKLAESSAAERYEKANREVLDQVGGSDPNGTACNKPRPGCVELTAAPEDRDQAAALSTAGFVAAGASAAAFGLTLWLWPSSPSPRVAVGAAKGNWAVILSGSL